MPAAIKDLYHYAKTGEMSQDLREWIDHGGWQSTLQSQDIIALIEAPEFRKLMGTRHKLINPITLGKAWFEIAKTSSDYREAFLRLAAFKKFKKEITENGGKPKRYVASIPEEIDAIETTSDKAWVMSNDLLGAYDRISVGGTALREAWIPFWSFQEVNMKRTIAMFRNAANNDEAVATVGRYLGAKTPILALKLGGLALKVTLANAVYQVWNEWRFPEEEDSLPEAMRNQSHIILGTYKVNGKKQIVYFPRVGVMGDFFEWFGAESAPSDVRDIMKLVIGGKSKEEIAREFSKIFGRYDYGKENIKSVINKMAQGMGPQVKWPLEYVMGEKFFPSVWNRQPITDDGRWVAEQFGLQEIYDKVMKRPQKPELLKRMVMGLPAYQEDQARLGWLAFRQKIVEYQRDSGLRGTGFIVTETGTALYNVGLAWRYGDMEAVAKYFTEYVLLNVKQLSNRSFDKVLQEQWEKLHPLADLNETHRGLFLAKMATDPRAAKQLALAFQYYAEISSGIQFLGKGKQ
jgi:hypothetical protein